MDQRCCMYEFRRDRQRYRFIQIGRMKLGGKDGQRGADALATASDQQLEHFGQRRKFDAQFVSQTNLDCFQFLLNRRKNLIDDNSLSGRG